MDTLQAIHTRQSIGKVTPQQPPRELIERLLAAAVQAPNHFRNRPWRFVVLTGNARERLGEVMAQSLAKRAPETPPDQLDAERKRPLRAPVLIAVGIDPPDQPKIIESENICAGAAAVQNLLLAAHDLELGAIWRTGAAALDPDVKSFFGFTPKQHLIAIVYVGYPEGARTPPNRPTFEDHTLWVEE